MKYIRFKHRGFVCFEETQTHSQIAEMIGDEVESAGFVNAREWCDDGKLCCHGESTTLKTSSRREDSDRLRSRFA